MKNISVQPEMESISNISNVSRSGISFDSRPNRLIGYDDIVRLQKANGSWEWNDIVGLVPAFVNVESADPYGDATIWATALIIRYLEAKFSSSINMWSLSTKKATSFVKKECSKKGFNFDNLVIKATECCANI